MATPSPPPFSISRTLPSASTAAAAVVVVGCWSPSPSPPASLLAARPLAGSQHHRFIFGVTPNATADYFLKKSNVIMYSVPFLLRSVGSTAVVNNTVRPRDFRTDLCWIVRHNVHSPQHTYVSSSYRSNRLGLSHWDPYAVHKGGCLELYYCNMVEWFWWDSSLILTTNWFFLQCFDTVGLVIWPV